MDAGALPIKAGDKVDVSILRCPPVRGRSPCTTLPLTGPSSSASLMRAAGFDEIGGGEHQLTSMYAAGALQHGQLSAARGRAGELVASARGERESHLSPTAAVNIAQLMGKDCSSHSVSRLRDGDERTQGSGVPGGLRLGCVFYRLPARGGGIRGRAGESIWDRFCATPGKVRNGESGAVACDFYHRYREDIALVSELGVDSFRFSVSWPRIMPSGRGEVNDKGFGFYDRLVDALLEAGDQATDSPLPLGPPPSPGRRGRLDEPGHGGGLRRVLQGRRRALRRPRVAVGDPGRAVGDGLAGLRARVHAPGRCSEADAVAASHHLLLSHGRAVEVLRGVAPRAEVGIALNLDHFGPPRDRDEDHEALRWWDGTRSRWYLDPLFRGEYPADVLQEWEHLMPAVTTAISPVSPRPSTSSG